MYGNNTIQNHPQVQPVIDNGNSITTFEEGEFDNDNSITLSKDGNFNNDTPVTKSVTLLKRWW